MSTAFFVDNILSDKEERSESLISDTEESDTVSDIKDSVCSSPDLCEHRNNNYAYDTKQQPSPPSSGGSDERTHKITPFSDTIFRTYNTMMLRSESVTSDQLDDSCNFVEMCCSKCGHFQQLSKRGDTRDDHNTEIDIDFKCDKCDCNEGVIASSKETQTLLKESAKPILKFSVSAILGDKRECTKSRNGKNELLMNFSTIQCTSTFGRHSVS